MSLQVTTSRMVKMIPLRLSGMRTLCGYQDHRVQLCLQRSAD